jgi:acetyl esterase/lipase
MPRIELWENAPGFDPGLGQAAPGLELYLLDDGQPHGLVIVLPGGGYNHLAVHEGEPIARWLNAAGFSACVLNYRVAPYRHPFPWLDAGRAVRTVRAHATQWKVKPDKIGVLGFSAGGHLAATLSTCWDTGDPAAPDPVEHFSSRPDAAVLCYAVVTFTQPFSHAGSGQSLLGEGAPAALRRQLSAENNVTAETPPCFFWHTADDEKVPVENSFVFATALKQHGVPFELHVFPHGRHGLGLANDDPMEAPFPMGVGQWRGLCAGWLKGQGF